MALPFQLLLILLGLCNLWQKADSRTLGKPVITASPEGTLFSVVDVFCEVDENPEEIPVLYQLFKEGDYKKAIGDYTSHSGEAACFPLYIILNYDGNLICKASGHNNTEVTPTYSDPFRFRVIEKVEGAHIVSEPDSEVLWEGDRVILSCNVIKGTYISYKWLLNDEPVQHQYNTFQKELTIERVSLSDGGKYTCVASNQFNGTEYSSSSFDGRDVEVKEHVSDPEMLFEVVKEEDGNFSALVICQSEKGPSSVTFSLVINDNVVEETVRDLRAIFKVPVQLDQDMGLVLCQASDGSRTVHSNPRALKVESVGGAVTMTLVRKVEHDFEVLGVWLQCSVERGTFPHYYWYLNNSRLENPGQYYFVIRPNDAILAFILAPEVAGIYYCEAANAFDNTTRVRSEKRLINKEVLNRIPVSVVVIVFTSFFLLIVAVTACCLYGLVIRKKKVTKYRDLKEDFTEMSRMADEVEDGYNDEDDEGLVVDSYAYEEDMDVVEASRIEDSEDSDEGEEEDDISVQEEESSTQNEDTDVQKDTETE